MYINFMISIKVYTNTIFISHPCLAVEGSSYVYGPITTTYNIKVSCIDYCQQGIGAAFSFAGACVPRNSM